MKTLMMIIFTLTSTMSFASGDTVLVKVKGMVCAFCSNGIEKKFKAKEEIENVKVDLGKKLVTLTFKEGKKIETSEIKSMIEGAGYTVDSIE